MPVPVKMIMLTFRLRLTRDLGRDVRHTHSGNLVFYSVRSSAEYFDHTARQTPDEMYFGKGGDVPDKLEAARQKARKERIETNWKRTCRACERPVAVAS